MRGPEKVTREVHGVAWESSTLDLGVRWRGERGPTSKWAGDRGSIHGRPMGHSKYDGGKLHEEKWYLHGPRIFCRGN